MDIPVIFFHFWLGLPRTLNFQLSDFRTFAEVTLRWCWRSPHGEGQSNGPSVQFRLQECFWAKKKTWAATWGFPEMVGFPNWPMGFPTKNDHFGVWNGGTTIYRNTRVAGKLTFGTQSVGGLVWFRWLFPFQFNWWVNLVLRVDGFGAFGGLDSDWIPEHERDL